MKVQKKPITTDTIIAVAATITSICALLIAVYQTVITREQQLNSVWPYLLVYESTDERNKATIQVTNNGVGPAIVESVTIQYKNNPYNSMIEVVQAMSKQLGRGPYGIRWSHSTIEKGIVISQSQTVDWISAYDSSDYTVFRDELANIKAVIHFKSIYGERWRTNFHMGQKEDAVVKE